VDSVDEDGVFEVLTKEISSCARENKRRYYLRKRNNHSNEMKRIENLIC